MSEETIRYKSDKILELENRIKELESYLEQYKQWYSSEQQKASENYRYRVAFQTLIQEWKK